MQNAQKRHILKISQKDCFCASCILYVYCAIHFLYVMLFTEIYTLKNLEHLAEVFNYNYSYLSALFNKITSRTLFEYYQNRRMEAARLLIDEGVFSITQISEMLGYSSIYAFSRAFKLYYGHPPKTYSKK